LFMGLSASSLQQPGDSLGALFSAALPAAAASF